MAVVQQMIQLARIRAAQTHIDGLDKWIELINHPGIKNDFVARRIEIKRHLHRLEGAYKEACLNADKWRVA